MIQPPEGWAPVAYFEERDAAQDAGLAILAMGLAYWLIPDDGQYVLFVEESRQVAVNEELQALGRLERQRKHNAHDFDEKLSTVSRLPFIVYLILLSGIFWAQSQWDITSIGRVDANQIVGQHELWRVITALTLHADIAHLTSNLIGGVALAFLVVRIYGNGLGWLLILISGGLGNLLNVAVQYPESHLSIGASTAVFGALGIVTGTSVWWAIQKPKDRLFLPNWYVPMLGGLTLLGLLGFGEGPIDVTAHLSGFACGVLLALLAQTLPKPRQKLVEHHHLCSVTALGLIAIAWLLAFSASST